MPALIQEIDKESIDVISIDPSSVKTKQHYIVPVLVDVDIDEENDFVFVKPHSNCIGSLLRTGSVDKDTFFKEAKPATVMDMDQVVIYNAYYKMLRSNRTTLNWEEVEAALTCGQHLTRKLWIENHVSLAVYRDGDLEPHAPLKIYSNNRDQFSTGWTPTDEDKQATDWVVV